MALFLTAPVNELLEGLLTQELYFRASQVSSRKLYPFQRAGGTQQQRDRGNGQFLLTKLSATQQHAEGVCTQGTSLAPGTRAVLLTL